MSKFTVINNTKDEVEEPRTLKWYAWNQNNSGGEFHVNDNVAHRLFIEAYSEEEADRKAQDLGVYYNGVDDGFDCDCCGDRWYSPEKLEFPINWGGPVFNNIHEYAGYMADNYGWTEPDGYLYYYDGMKAAVHSDKVK